MASMESLQTICRACDAMPRIRSMFYRAAWMYGVYERARLDACEYLESHNARPTKEREALQVSCCSKAGAFDAMITALHMIVSQFGSVDSQAIREKAIAMTSDQDMHDLYRMSKAQ